jgi:uncharacterized protein YecT (DUF1311 family)
MTNGEKMKKYFLFVFLFTAAVFYAQSENTHPIDKKMSECMDVGGSTMGMASCMNEAYKNWDKELNKYYKKLHKVLDPASQKVLKETQSLWIKLQQKNDALIFAVYSSQEGTVVQIQVVEAKLDFLKHRALELKYLYESISPEGQ